MAVVRLVNNTVIEIIPEYALPVEEWFSPEFCQQCHEVDKEVTYGWTYDPVTNKFNPPSTDETPFEYNPDGTRK